MLYPRWISRKARVILLIIAGALLAIWGILLVKVEEVHAQVDPMNLGKLTNYVVDYSNTLSSEQVTAFNERARIYEEQTTNQIAVALIPNRNGNELYDIWLKIFRETALWQKEKNNGLLLVIATEEKKIRIVVWYGLEGDVPDVLANNIIEESIRPLVNEGKFAEAVQIYYERVTAAIWTQEWQQAVQASQEGNIEDMYVVIAAFLWFLLGLIGLRIFGFGFIPVIGAMIFLSFAGLWMGYLMWGIFAFAMKQRGHGSGIFPGFWWWFGGGFGGGWGFSFWWGGGSSGGGGAGD